MNPFPSLFDCWRGFHAELGEDVELFPGAVLGHKAMRRELCEAVDRLTDRGNVVGWWFDGPVRDAMGRDGFAVVFFMSCEESGFLFLEAGCELAADRFGRSRRFFVVNAACELFELARSRARPVGGTVL